MKKRALALVLAVLILMMSALPAMARNYRSTYFSGGNRGCLETYSGSGSGENSWESGNRGRSDYNHQNYNC